jgi:hypothetical protein
MHKIILFISTHVSIHNHRCNISLAQIQQFTSTNITIYKHKCYNLQAQTVQLISKNGTIYNDKCYNLLNWKFYLCKLKKSKFRIKLFHVFLDEDTYWSHWSDFSRCFPTCGEGTQTRTRFVPTCIARCSPFYK